MPHVSAAPRPLTVAAGDVVRFQLHLLTVSQNFGRGLQPHVLLCSQAELHPFLESYPIGRADLEARLLRRRPGRPRRRRSIGREQ